MLKRLWRLLTLKPAKLIFLIASAIITVVIASVIAASVWPAIAITMLVASAVFMDIVPYHWVMIPSILGLALIIGAYRRFS